MLTITKGKSRYLTTVLSPELEFRLSRGVDRKAIGLLAVRWKLSDKIPLSQYERLVEGKHPNTGKKIVRDARGQEYTDQDGATHRRVEHRAGWDATVSAPKSVSEAALVGEDERLIEAHREAVAVTLAELEKFAQVRTGANDPPVTTRNLCIVQFEHHSARPVDGFFAPQLHTHNLIFNVTERRTGKFQAVEPLALYEAQHYLTTVYRCVLAEKVMALGFRIKSTKNGAWELAGYRADYLAAISPRAEQRDQELRERGLSYSPAAAQFAVLNTREGKGAIDPAALRESWRQKAVEFRADKWRPQGGEPILLWESDRDRRRLVAEAVTHGLSVALDRTGRADETTVLQEALKLAPGRVRLAEAKRELAGRIGLGEVIETTPSQPGMPWSTLTTPKYERLWDEIKRMVTASVPRDSAQSLEVRCPDGRIRELAKWVVECRRRVIEIDGTMGKQDDVAVAVAESYYLQGYEIAVVTQKESIRRKYESLGCNVTDLENARPRPDRPTVFLVHEDVMTSVTRLHAFLMALNPDDRVLGVGDVRGRIAAGEGELMERLRHAGMAVAATDDMIQTKSPEVREAITNLFGGRPKEGFDLLRLTGCVVGIADTSERVGALANAYVRDPDHTVVVSNSRRVACELTEEIRDQLKETGRIDSLETTLVVLTIRGDMTGDARAEASNYEVGNLIEYREASASFEKGERARVVAVEKKFLTVETGSGRQVRYEPRTLRGVMVYREETRDFAVGDRVLITGVNHDLELRRKRIGIITEIGPDLCRVALPGKPPQSIEYDPGQACPFDYAYVLTDLSGVRNRFNRVLIESSRGEHARESLASARDALLNATIMTDDIEDLRANLQCLFPEGKQEAVAKSLSVAENPDLDQVVAEVRVNRVARAYENLHRKMTGQSYAGKHFDEEALAALVGVTPSAEFTEQTDSLRRAAKLEPRIPRDALDSVADRVEAVRRANIADQGRFVRSVLCADGTDAKTAERQIIGGIFEVVRKMPEERQVGMALHVLDRVLQRANLPVLGKSERERVGQKLVSATVLTSPLTGADSFQARMVLETANDRDTLIALGLQTGDLGGFPEVDHDAPSDEMAHIANQALKRRGADGLTLLTERLGYQDGIHAFAPSESSSRTVFLTVEASKYLTERNWNDLQTKFGEETSICVIHPEALTQADLTLLRDASRRNDTVYLGKVASLGADVMLTWESGVPSSFPAEIRDSRLAMSPGL